LFHDLESHRKDIVILETNLWSCHTESHIILHLHWLIKSNEWGRQVAGDQGGMLRKATPPKALAMWFRDYVIQWLCAYLLFYETWVHWTVSSCYSGSTKHTLVWYAVVLWDEA